MLPVTKEDHTSLVGQNVLMKAPHPHIGDKGIVTSIKHFVHCGWGLSIKGTSGEEWVSFDADEVSVLGDPIFDREQLLNQLAVISVDQRIKLFESDGGGYAIIVGLIPGEGDAISFEVRLEESGEVITITQFDTNE